MVGCVFLARNAETGMRQRSQSDHPDLGAAPDTIAIGSGSNPVERRSQEMCLSWTHFRSLQVRLQRETKTCQLCLSHGFHLLRFQSGALAIPPLPRVPLPARVLDRLEIPTLS